MPILQIQSIHSHSSPGSGALLPPPPPYAAACRSSVQLRSAQGPAAAEQLRVVISEGAHSKRVNFGYSAPWKPSRSYCCCAFRPHLSEVGESESIDDWCGIGSEKRRRRPVTNFFQGKSLSDRKMAASAVAKPVLYKLDSIPNDVPVAVSASENSWTDAKRNDRLIVVGHRGCGKNNALTIGDVPGTRLSVRENTIKSFNLAASNGADYAEFDVQVTKDGHPVIFHDDLILSAEGKVSRIGDLTLDEFLSFGPQKDGKAGKSLVRKQKDGVVKAWATTLEDSLCTLQDAFELVQPSLGFNIEVKFHDTDETPEPELRRVISAVLADVENYANGRTIYFSSFHPDGAIILRQEQNTYSVFMLTEGGEKVYSDSRRNSVEAAVNVCLQNGLQGVVSEVLAILKNPELAALVKNAGLSLFTYGDMNNVAEALAQQYNLKVDGVIVDCVREIVTASRTLHALLNFVQPDWAQFLQPPARDVQVQ